MPFYMEVTGLDELTAKMQKLPDKGADVAALALYEGAAIVADAVSSAVHGIATEEFHYTKFGKRLPSPEEKAILLGAKHALGVDIDPMAVQVARENVQKNGLENTVRVEEGDLTKGLDHPPFDIVVANILADVILLLLPDLPPHLKKDGVFICSGILRERAQEVRGALEARGFRVLQYEEQGDWAAFAASRSLPQNRQ